MGQYVGSLVQTGTGTSFGPFTAGSNAGQLVVALGTAGGTTMTISGGGFVVFPGYSSSSGTTWIAYAFNDTSGAASSPTFTFASSPWLW